MALGVAVLVLALVAAVQALRIGRLAGRLDRLTRGEQGGSLEAVLDDHLGRVAQVGKELDELAVRTAVIEANSRRGFQRFGLVRLNPFAETGGNQSFAVAPLDANGDGFVLSSLHARAGTRLYAKPLVRGRAEGALSVEESEAVERAMAVGPGDR